ncbi:putative beta-amylase [Monocercomonoides exilis]|uniref:putative beta-amylase n=1 Tax=Monocercomonoides exilis TaxID=2049356 RepID=UPI00355AA0F4|nr:putative beta-amylase [Monocercomonoides exilis]|eukprot:MONOS_6069.1-p1 / transcript=MONOS_6069.1 / gene=MONOS_6069 / organism=Monocercomonoides_exilis_PA203 / gene_product=beta-amylase / transcript_product=beta-amylase / location=Mono_scaffold00186:35586-36932(+) / protein_length=448 / sequence_SO=supercontig / SO=protein_coding / is_pseudo=false
MLYSLWRCLLLFIVGSFCAKLNVMLPLWTVSNDGILNEAVTEKFSMLKNLDVHGVMIDVWWGICEKTPKNYNFEAYKTIAEKCKETGLKMQCVMSFHRCGGNVGDDYNVSLPSWVTSVSGIWYRDINKKDDLEVVSLAVDNETLFEGRTAVQLYANFMEAFKEEMKDYLGSVIEEIQVGLGPCGELRYPSYQLDKWTFPGIGMFQTYSERMIKMFKQASKDAKHSWVTPPSDIGNYNYTPDESPFFRRINEVNINEYDRFFLKWYSSILLQHGRSVLTEAVNIFRNNCNNNDGTNVEIAMKVSGIHWLYRHQSHAAELTAGYNNGKWLGQNEKDFYTQVAELCAELGVVLDFTCFEMSDIEQEPSSMSSPQSLVEQIQKAVRVAGAKMSAENALERMDRHGMNRIINNACNKKTPLEAFTFLRFQEEWINDTQLSDEIKRLAIILKRC